MAEMIPDRLPNSASAGEKKLFSILQNLPDDYIVYYELVVNNRHPDFVVICPDLGLLVIEVKGWYPKNIVGGNLNTIRVKESQGEIQLTHPIEQARKYMYSLMDECRKNRNSRNILESQGEFKNKFIFPFGYFTVLSNSEYKQLKEHKNGDLTTIFPSNKTVYRDILENWVNESISPEQLRKKLKSFFDPFWSFNRLTDEQINTIRAIIHPEIVLSVPRGTNEIETVNNDEVSLKILDLKQENNARNIGEGHRIIYGVAGSGKTVLLIAKAKLMSSQDPNCQILFLCYNVALAFYLRNILKDFTNITVKHFDDWAKSNGVTRRRDPSEEDEDLGNRLLTQLENGCSDSRKYDAVMIDEAQDFAISWFKCVLESMKEPNDGDLIRGAATIQTF